MPGATALREFIAETVLYLLEAPGEVGPETILVGRGAALSSLQLVGLLVALEDYCLDHGMRFVWATDAAMSEKRSRYRTVASLADYVLELQDGASGEGA